MLHETRNLALHQVITQWQASDDFADSSLRSFVLKTYGDTVPRPADLDAELAQTLSLLAARLGIEWTAGSNEPKISAPDYSTSEADSEQIKA